MLHDVHMSTLCEEQPLKEERYSGDLLIRSLTCRLLEAVMEKCLP